MNGKTIMAKIILISLVFIACLSDREYVHQRARRARAQRRVRSRVRPRTSARKAGRTRRRMQFASYSSYGSYASDSSCCDCTNTESDSGCSSNPECEQIVCPLDPYCCQNSWDSICANGANNICKAKDYWSNPGDTDSCCECTEIGDGPGCNQVCEDEVCPLDSYCCNNYWDSICANGANNICEGYDYWNQGGSSSAYGSSYNEEPEEVKGSCCDCQDSQSGPFCNSECDAEICPLDNYCCNVQWDWICANAAKDICAADQKDANKAGNKKDKGQKGGCCGCTDENEVDGPNCNKKCDAEICPFDSYCCNVEWDWICANSAKDVCESYEPEGCCDCTDAKGDANCNEVCDSQICPLDPYCCKYSWDGICANSANQICEGQEQYDNSYSSMYSNNDKESSRTKARIRARSMARTKSAARSQRGGSRRKLMSWGGKNKNKGQKGGSDSYSDYYPSSDYYGGDDYGSDSYGYEPSSDYYGYGYDYGYSDSYNYDYPSSDYYGDDYGYSDYYGYQPSSDYYGYDYGYSDSYNYPSSSWYGRTKPRARPRARVRAQRKRVSPKLRARSRAAARARATARGRSRARPQKRAERVRARPQSRVRRTRRSRR